MKINSFFVTSHNFIVNLIWWGKKKIKKYLQCIENLKIINVFFSFRNRKIEFISGITTRKLQGQRKYLDY